VERSGAEWSGMERNGMWNGMWNGMEQNNMKKEIEEIRRKEKGDKKG
jgi:hypothetical protein